MPLFRLSPFCNLRRAALSLFALSAVWGSGARLDAQGSFNVFTRNYNNQRTGANLSETALNTVNVNASQFGKLFMLGVDDEIYAGILYASGVPIGGVNHNVIYAATVNNTVYAFDADKLGAPLWKRNFNGTGRPTRNSEVGGACGNYQDFQGNIGIIGTPVIRAVTRTMYFVTRTIEAGATVQRLHAVDITSGRERAASPQIIQAAVPGTGDGGATVTFNSVTHNQRSALALSQGVIYIAWASFCDTRPYHGWVMTYDATSLTQLGAYNDTPNGSQAGIWMAGAGPSFDANGNTYLSTGNGTFDGTTGYGESLVKLAPSSLTQTDFFTPSNYNSLNATDLDFGSAGPSMVPGTTLLITGGKQGKLYLLDTNNLGKEASGDTQIPQSFQAVDTTVRPTGSHHIHNANPWWLSPAGLNLYVWGENDYLRGFRFDTGTNLVVPTAFATGSILPPSGMPGGMLTVSANGAQAGSGVVWATASRNGDANHSAVPGNLYAFNAETLDLLWSSTGVGDDLLGFSKGSIPMVANGKVYAGTLSKFIEVYGLRSGTVPTQNLALNKAATGSAPCAADETPDKAVNGSYSGGNSDKWCSSAAGPFLQVDLGGNHNVRRFVVEHAGAGGESFGLNTSAYNVQVSTDGVNFVTVETVTGNQASITTDDIAPVAARYVRLNVIKATQGSDTSARIYEFQIFGSGAL